MFIVSVPVGGCMLLLNCRAVHSPYVEKGEEARKVPDKTLWPLSSVLNNERPFQDL